MKMGKAITVMKKDTVYRHEDGKAITVMKKDTVYRHEDG